MGKSGSGSGTRCPSARMVLLQPLEPRLMMSAALAIPALSSRSWAPVKLYLDFDGDYTSTWGSYRPGTTPAYDQDGNASSFSWDEIASIREIWGRVAEKYSPFNLDVTTINPGNLSNGRALKVIFGGAGSWMGGDGGGIGYINSFTNSSPNTAYVFTRNLSNGSPRYAAEAAAHEAGHAFGLEHQVLWSGGRLSDEYYKGRGGRAPIMGSSYGATRGVWWYGTTSGSAWSRQDDLAILTSAKNGFGYRADDHAASLSRATALSGSSPTDKGVIERHSDVDAFSFSISAGAVSITAKPFEKGGMLDLKLTLRRSNGGIVATADTWSLGETINRTLAAGKYIIEVASHGTYGDLGQYTVWAKAATSSATPVSAKPSKSLPPAPHSLTATAASATSVRLTWHDASSNEMGFKIERTTDRVYWSQVATAGVNARTATVWGLKANTLYYFRVRAYNSVGNSAFSGVASARTASASATPATAIAGRALFSTRLIERGAPAAWPAVWEERSR